MLTVYLDQNKWIDLARAESGHPHGVRFVETLAVLKAAADDGRARFPLSMAHYYETGKQRDRRKREELAATMTRLAGMLRIAPPHVIVSWEIKRALIDSFGLGIPVEELDQFGFGSLTRRHHQACAMWHPPRIAGYLSPQMCGRSFSAESSQSTSA